MSIALTEKQTPSVLTPPSIEVPRRLQNQDIGQVFGSLLSMRSTKVVLIDSAKDHNVIEDIRFYSQRMDMNVHTMHSAGTLSAGRGKKSPTRIAQELKDFSELEQDNGLIIIRNVDYSGETDKRCQPVAEYLLKIINQPDSPHILAVGNRPTQYRNETLLSSPVQELLGQFATTCTLSLKGQVEYQ